MARKPTQSKERRKVFGKLWRRETKVKWTVRARNDDVLRRIGEEKP